MKVLLGIFCCLTVAAADSITEITLERRGCYSRCRVYSVRLRNDGTASYTGVRQVDRKGVYRETWKYIRQFERLGTAIAALNPFQLPATHGLNVKDAEIVRVTITMQSFRTRTMETRDLSAAQQELWTIITLIDGASSEVRWQTFRVWYDTTRSSLENMLRVLEVGIRSKPTTSIIWTLC